MDVLNLSIEFHHPEGTNVTKKIVRIDPATKIGEFSKLLLDKFGRSSEVDPLQYQLLLNTPKSTVPFQVLSDLNKSIANYNIKNNDELVFKKRPKKVHPSNAKLTSKKKPDSIFKTLFSMSTLEMKLGEEKTQPEISEVENQIDDPLVLFKAIEYLTQHFQSAKDVDEILASFQYVGSEIEYTELIKLVNQNEHSDIPQAYRNPKILCSFILNLLHLSFSQTSLTYSLYTTFLKSTNNDIKSSIFYDIPPKSRIILKHIMLFLSSLTCKDPNLLDTISSIIAPFIIGSVEAAPSSTTPPQQQQQLVNNLNNSFKPLAHTTSPLMSSSNVSSSNINISPPPTPSFSSTTQTPPSPSLTSNNNNNNLSANNTIGRSHNRENSKDSSRTLSPNENNICKKVAVDLIQNLPLYLLFSPLKVSQLEGERVLFSSENIYCIDKSNFPPLKASLGEIWVTNYRVLFVNSAKRDSMIPNSSSSTSLSSLLLSPSQSYTSFTSSTSNTPNHSGSYYTPTTTTTTMNHSGGMPPPSTSTSTSPPLGSSSGGTGMTQSVSSLSLAALTNLTKLSTSDNSEIPLSMIYKWKPLKTGTLYESFKIYCKDFRCKVIGFPINSPFLYKFKEILESLKQYSSSPQQTFAFQFNEKNLAHTENFSESLLLKEFNRQGISWDHWRICNVNSNLKVCDSYPSWSVVPKLVNDNIVVTSAYYRSFRFPVLSWNHPNQKSSIIRAAGPEESNSGGNNSHPNQSNSSGSLGYNSGNNVLNSNSINNTSTSNIVGGGFGLNPINTPSSSYKSASFMLSPTQNHSAMSPTSTNTPRIHSSISSSAIPQVCQEDIDFLKTILDIKSSNMLTVFDTGPNAAYASTMIGCQIEFLELANTAKTKERYNKLMHLHLTNPDAQWSETIRFNWLDPLKTLLSAAISIATAIDQGRSVLIQHCGDPDIDAQISSIAQILLDPYYRTIDGFRVLIEKEWICYGHQFAKRSNYDQKFDNFSPIFMQFIFIVWQIWKEFPTSFQFNELYLITILDNIFSSRFGTFLCNNIKERTENNIYSGTKSFWSYVEQHFDRFMNPYSKVTFPLPAIQHLKCQRIYQDTMWNEYFYRYCFKSSLAIEQLEERIRATTPQLSAGVSSSAIPTFEFLDLSGLKLYYLPSDSALYHISNLRELTLAKNNLNHFSVKLSSLINLEKLSLEDNCISNVPYDSMCLISDKLVNLRELNLSTNQFADLPHELARFKNLTSLNIRNNKFVSIPDVIAQLHGLVELDISDCDFSQSSSPTSVPTNLDKLKLLNLNHSRLGSLTKEFGDLKSLVKLYLDFNNLNSVPSSFAQLQCVEELSLNFNQFTEFPEELCSLASLKKLSMEGNQLTFLPNTISQLIYLSDLNLKQNKLESLPASIGQMSNLVSVNLMNNNLTALRPTMGLLTNLTSLKLDGNRIKTPPPEIQVQGLKPMLLYLKDLIKGQEQCYKMKLMIVGQENVGKTTLLKTLREKKKKAALGPNISTDGISIDNWVFSGQFEEKEEENNRTIKKKQDVTLSIWDFAGQEIYYTTHQFFLSERSVYIVAWNLCLAEEESRVEFWLQSISTRAKDAPIIIVGTHLDDVNRNNAKPLKKKMKEKYCTRFPNIKAIKLVSCTSGKGIPSLRETLESVVTSQPTMGESLPRSYMLLENLVKEETKKRVIPTIPWSEFIQLGSICTITDEAELLRATMFLNQLGSLVYFPKEPGLKQFVILDPQWITTMLSSIITTKHSYAKDGILMHKSLKQIWRPPQYPNHLHPHLISLLEKFEISFNVSQDSGFENGMSLIPSLLSNERPAAFATMWPPYDPHVQQFGRIYQFEFIPNGFFSRLMVRILNFARTEVKCYWKNGMLLHHDQEQILLELNHTKKSLTFMVRGMNSATLSRDVIETIQSLLDDSFQLPTQIYIPCVHCLQLKTNHHPYKFPLEVCENAAVKGTGYLKCQGVYNVRTDLLVPDLVMSNFTGAKIPFEELQMDGLIGEGGAALVYRAIWKGQVVAVKRLKTIENDNDPDCPIEINDISLSKAFKEFRRECWIMSDLEHPNIVQLRGLCLDPLCIVTEYLPHGNLYSFLHGDSSNEMGWIFRLKVALDISSGMAFLHSSTPPIIHRDLKSPNILLASLDESSATIAKVVDFGLSGLQHTITNRGVENPLWLAPEILSKTKEYSTQSDVYAFGVILWELLTRKDYFGQYTFMTLIEEKVIAGERPDIPSDCHLLYAQLIQDCWQNNPNERPKFSEIEDRILNIIETMFPDLPLYEPSNHHEKRKSLNSSLNGIRHRKNPSTSSEISIDTHGTSMIDDGVENGGSSSLKRQQSQESNGHTTTTTTTNTATDEMESLKRSKTDDSISSYGIDESSSQRSLAPSKSELELEFRNLDLINNSNSAPSTPKKVLYMNKRNSISVQPFYNEFTKELLPNEGTIQCLQRVGNHVWVGTGSGVMSIWRADNSEKVKSFNAHTKRIVCLYNYMNNQVWSGSVDGSISIWSADNFSLIKTLTGYSPTCFTRVGHTMWVGSIVNCVHVFDLKKKVKYKGKIQLKTGPVECLLRRGENSEVWAALNNQIARIDVNSQRVVQMLNAHDKAIHCMIEVEGTIWSSSSDGMIKIWSIQSGQLLESIEAHKSRIFDLILVGDYVWSGSWDTTIKIWSIKDYRLVSENQGKHSDAISCFVYLNPEETFTSPATLSPNEKDKVKDKDKSTTTTNNNQQQQQQQQIQIQIPKQIWSGSWDSSICIWNLYNGNGHDFYDRTRTNSSMDLKLTPTNSNNNQNHNNHPASSYTPASTSSLLSSIPETSPPLSSSPTHSSTLRGQARRTVSFVFDKFGSSPSSQSSSSSKK
ncbi:hypothetical protein CYY_007084 [Polysphondylium violaceum]|uniref:non-specific serine/threonine protein kinase n=1 Tax=Polysphondylium violaceum TaxID=133409 RepID=A0A8J4V570_9MYCE|nr:hypothetical protein CYY_007084 [Polysphondylium violaceum]